jgi:hypothetical protein
MARFIIQSGVDPAVEADFGAQGDLVQIGAKSVELVLTNLIGIMALQL